MKLLAKLTLPLLFAVETACSVNSPTPTMERTPVPAGGAVYIDTADLLIMESYPVQVALHITGNLPTPCHEFNYSYQIGTPEDRFRVDFTVWSESDPAVMCTQVLQPLDENLPLPMGGAPDGTYSVWLNGEFVGEFSYPG